MSRLIRSRLFAVALAASTVVACSPLCAETYKPGENPLSVIMKWRPSTPDPEVKDFVKATRPDDDSLKYKTLKEPKLDRPKLKTKDEMNAMVRGLDDKGAALKGRGAVFGKSDAGGLTRKLEAAAAESRRRALEDFATKPAR